MVKWWLFKNRMSLLSVSYSKSTGYLALRQMSLRQMAFRRMFFLLLLFSLPSAKLTIGLTRVLHLVLSLIKSVAVLIFKFFVLKSFMLSIQVFGCLPLFLLPSMKQCNTLRVSQCSTFFSTCQNHLRRFFCISEHSVSSWPSLLRINSFRSFWSLETPKILLSQLIYIADIFLSSHFFNVQHSDPYVNTGITSASYTLILVLSDMLPNFHILFSLPTIAEAKLERLLMSFSHLPSSVSRLPKYTKSSTCSSVLFPSSMLMSSCLLLITVVFVFCSFMRSSNRLIHLFTSVVNSWSCCGDSDTRSMSSAKFVDFWRLVHQQQIHP